MRKSRETACTYCTAQNVFPLGVDIKAGYGIRTQCVTHGNAKHPVALRAIPQNRHRAGSGLDLADQPEIGGINHPQQFGG